MSYFHNVALWAEQSINSTVLCISSHFKCQDQSSTSQGLYWAADYIIKMLNVKQEHVFPSTPGTQLIENIAIDHQMRLVCYEF